MRVLQSDECLAPDRLLTRPTKNFGYIDRQGRLKDYYKYASAPVEEKTSHPKLLAHRANGTETRSSRYYYQDMPPDVCLPVAGKIRDQPDPRDTDNFSLVGEAAGFFSSRIASDDESLRESSAEHSICSIDPNPVLTRSLPTVGGKLSRKTINQARNTRPYKGDARGRLGERNKEPAARTTSLRSSRKHYPRRLP